MTRPQKILTGVLWLLAIVASVTFIAAKTSRNRVKAQTPALPVIADVPRIDLVDAGRSSDHQSNPSRPTVGRGVLSPPAALHVR